MLIFVLQTLAEILAGGTSLTSTEQIDFSQSGKSLLSSASYTHSLHGPNPTSTRLVPVVNAYNDKRSNTPETIASS